MIEIIINNNSLVDSWWALGWFSDTDATVCSALYFYVVHNELNWGR
jgi:hypothetical protein